MKIIAGYKPLKITGNSTGLVQQREEFILPDDAYPKLQNAYVWRERIKRKQGYQLLGRLQRNIGTTDITGNAIINITPTPIKIGVATFTIGNDTFTDPGGASPVNLLTNSSGTATLDRAGGVLTITGSIPSTLVQYFPGLPVMGLRQRELQNATLAQTVAFDQNYAYVFSGGVWQEFIPGTTWNANGSSVSGVDFFWSTNYWVDDVNRKIFWATNYSGITGDPIRFTNGVSWQNFAPSINDNNDLLTQCLCLLPFRGRLLAFNTLEGQNLATSLTYSNRIRWSAIGTPFTTAIPGMITTPSPNAWKDDIRGKGGFLDIPTSEDIISVGFVRDNLVIYCERSTWQLRYTGRTISPFQIEKVNSENGVEGTFSPVQFDTSLVGIGDKGILECDSYKAELIDVKIPDFVFQFNTANNGVERVHGIRDFINRLTYWTIPTAAANGIFPDQRLVYNYENDSWALFNDSLTCLGTIQAPTNRTWLNTPIPWVNCNFPWITNAFADPIIIGGNQQGFVEQLDQLNTNDVSLFIQNITANTTTPTVITSSNHNMQSEFVIEISGIEAGDPFESFNGQVFGIIVLTADTFQLMKYNPSSGQFNTPQLDVPGDPYQGKGFISIRENFNIVSKKFNFIDQGQSIQLGYLDILMSASEDSIPGAISLNVYLDYDDDTVSNKTPDNASNDTFFNSVIPTTKPNLSNIKGSKFWHRCFCPTRANFITLEYTFSNAQMAGDEQETDVQIDAQVLWLRPAGRMNPI